MTKIFLPALAGAALLLGVIGAQAMPASDPTLMHYTSVDEFRHQGNYAVDFIQGRLLSSRAPASSPAAAAAEEDGATRYASQSTLMTIVFFAVVALALGSLALLLRLSRAPVLREAAPKDAWKGALMEMLEADLTNLDSVTHGFSGR